MKKKGQVRKRCVKCGTVAMYRPTVRRCRHQRFGRMSYWCYGTLVAVPRKAQAPGPSFVQVPQGKGIGWVLSGEAMDMQVKESGARMRAYAQKKFDDANERIVDEQRQVARLTRSISLLQRKARHWQKRSVMTDAQVEAERTQRKDRQARRAVPVRRGIRLGGGAK